MIDTLKINWRIYLMEAWGLGTFMVSAVLFTILIEHPALPVRLAFDEQPGTRRFLIGIAMGITAIGIIYSPWGKRSGAHLNPAVTLSFLFLKKIKVPDAIFYIIFQFIGGYLGVVLFNLFVFDLVSDPHVNYAITIPGKWGTLGAFFFEALLSFTLFITVLLASNHNRWNLYTGVFAGFWLMLFITLEAPFSGMSINPARTVASALPANNWTQIWIYFTAPPLGMLLAAYVYKFHCHKASKVLKCHMSGEKHNCCTYVE